MDIYQRYYQISLAQKDQDKINFIMTKNIFYYTVILFELKNIKATYQRDKIFTE